MRQPLVIAHRGASHDAIDNSVEAFERAIAEGADMIEFDVRRVSDGRLIAFHDALVGDRPVATFSHEEITAALGYRPVLFEEVLELAEGRIGLDVELKEAGYVGRVLDAVRDRFPAGDVMVTSFIDAVVAETRAIWPEVRTGLLEEVPSTRGNTPDRLRERARACGAAGLGLEHALVDRDGFDWVADEGLALYLWTINEPEALTATLRDPRIDGVVTDVPAVAVQVHPRPEVSA